MANIPIKHINSGDTISTAFDIVNYNFDLLVLNGGGPRGIQGIQGTQGNRGIQGVQGIQGTTGTSVYTNIDDARNNNGIYFDVEGLYSIDFTGGGQGGGGSVSPEVSALNPFILNTDGVIRTNKQTAADKNLVLGLYDKDLTTGASLQVVSPLNGVVASNPNVMSILHCQLNGDTYNIEHISTLKGDNVGNVILEPSGVLNINKGGESGLRLQGLADAESGKLLNLDINGKVEKSSWAIVGDTLKPTNQPNAIGDEVNDTKRVSNINLTQNSVIESKNVGEIKAQSSVLTSASASLIYNVKGVHIGNMSTFASEGNESRNFRLIFGNYKSGGNNSANKDTSISMYRMRGGGGVIACSNDSSCKSFEYGMIQLRGAIETDTYDGRPTPTSLYNHDVLISGGHFEGNIGEESGQSITSDTYQPDGGNVYVSGGLSFRTKDYHTITPGVVTNKCFENSFGDVHIGINPLAHYGVENDVVVSESETYETRNITLNANKCVSINSLPYYAELNNNNNVETKSPFDAETLMQMSTNANMSVYAYCPIIITTPTHNALMSGRMSALFNAGGIIDTYQCSWMRVGDMVTATYSAISSNFTGVYIPVIYATRTSETENKYKCTSPFNDNYLYPRPSNGWSDSFTIVYSIYDGIGAVHDFTYESQSPNPAYVLDKLVRTGQGSTAIYRYPTEVFNIFDWYIDIDHTHIHQQ